MTLAAPPTPPAVVDSTTWHAWDIALRYEAMERQSAGSAANTAAVNRQAAAMEAMVAAQPNLVKALDSYTDAEIVFHFMQALSGDWGASGRGAASLQSTAVAMLAEFRKKYPAPT